MRSIAAFFLITALAGCAATEQAQRSGGPPRPSARPVYNLTGYPPAFKDGYIDGCETAKKTSFALKDKRRFASDTQYRLGWNDGFSLCRR
ncbi:hypothetical protein [Nitrosovibrio tenuis]|uniref:Lipoprotein n=1 Tax=Nitrosovibrio tenuis TaxID=1233 RepID=A0A1H7Q1U0_9PROT|nr:hypothetical protein [Nitrosovibrio tenuis]SEL41688.1 hypothetical protein SAMN05216387_11084 [Nitrosovibrio tenuis]